MKLPPVKRTPHGPMAVLRVPHPVCYDTAVGALVYLYEAYGDDPGAVRSRDALAASISRAYAARGRALEYWRDAMDEDSREVLDRAEAVVRRLWPEIVP